MSDSDTAATASGALAQLMLPEEYQKARERHFPSKGSLDWYIRMRKTELVEMGAMLKHRGIWHVHAERFDRAVLVLAGLAAAA